MPKRTLIFAAVVLFLNLGGAYLLDALGGPESRPS